MSRVLNRWIRVVVIGFLAGLLYAVEPYKPIEVHPATEPWRWRLYEPSEIRDASCFMRDREGVLWMGTQKGVVRYDGIRWTRFFTNESFCNKFPRQIFQTDVGKIYYVTAKTVHFFEKDQWVEVYHFPRDQPVAIFSMYDLPDGSLWLSLNTGVLQLKNGIRTLWVPELVVEAKRLASDYDRVRMIGSTQSVDLTPLRLDASNDSPKWAEMPMFKRSCRSADGSVWFVSTKNKLYRLTYAGMEPTWKEYACFPGFNLSRITQIVEVQDGSLWFISNLLPHQIVRFDPRTKVWENLEGVLPFKVLSTPYSMAQSRDGTIWMSGIGGLLSFKDGVWNRVPKIYFPNPDAEISGLQILSDGALWLRLYEKGFARLDLLSERWQTYAGLHFHARGVNGDEWFISSDRQVVRKRGDKWLKFSDSDGIPTDPSTVFVTRAGEVWVAGGHHKKAAISRWNGTSWKRDIHKNFSHSIFPHSLFEDRDGALWFGSSHQRFKVNKGGLLCYPAMQKGQKSSFKRYANPVHDFLPLAGIIQQEDGAILTGGTLKRLTHEGLHKDEWEPFLQRDTLTIAQSDHGIWALNPKSGLFFLRQGKWEAHKGFDRFEDVVVRNILPWRTESLWMAAQQGIYYFDGRSWTQNMLHERLVNSGTVDSIYSDDSGSVWINMDVPDKFQLIEPRVMSDRYENEIFRTVRHRQNDRAPDTQMVQFPKQSHHQSDALFLSWTGSDVWNESSVDRLQYSYRLNGGGWSSFSSENNKVFADLKTGRYSFEVRARDQDFNSDPTPAHIEFMVVGPIWKKPWFIAFMFLMVSSILYLWIRLVRLHELRMRENLASEQEKVRQQQELNRYRLEFFTNISHEFRTPLTLILGPLERLLTGVKTPELKAQGALAKRNANRLLTLVNQLLDMRKLHAGQMRLEGSMADVVGFIREVSSSFEGMAEKKELSFVLDIPEESKLVSFDADKLEKIVVNLLSNALKFTPKGGMVRLQANIDASGIFLRIEDSGTGIDPEQHQLIFERFGQIPSAAGVKGTGIGLALTRDLVELHGGSITVKSPLYTDQTPPYGTAFIINLPWPEANVADEAEEIRSEVPVEDVAAITERSKILIVEDNPDMRKFIRLELASEYIVSEAVDGVEGLQRAKEGAPDLIISDVMMPNMDGFMLCSMLKEDLLTSHIPVILLTARGSQDARLEGFETGADDYMVKPFNSELLKVRVRNLLKLRQQLRQRFSDDPEAGPAEVTVSALDAAFLEKAMHIVEENFQDPDFSAELFAQLMGVSRRGLYRKLGAITNQSVSQFIRIVRLKKAVQLLSANAYSVAEVVYEVGFSSQAYFTRCFTKEFGQSPLKYISSLS